MRRYELLLFPKIALNTELADDLTVVEEAEEEPQEVVAADKASLWLATKGRTDHQKTIKIFLLTSHGMIVSLCVWTGTDDNIIRGGHGKFIHQ
jgi:hypothetical protein